MSLRKAGFVMAGALLALCAAQASAQTVARQGKVIPDQYIVVLKKPSSGGGLFDIIGIATPLLGKYGGQLLGSLGTNLPGFIAHLTPAQANAMAKDPKVSYVEQDQVVKAVAKQNGATWGLDRLDQRAPSLDREYRYPDKAGEGAHVYVVDTGIRASHAEFKGRVGTGRNFAPNSGGGGLPLPIPIIGDVLGGILGGGGSGGGGTDPEDVADCNGHGTHVAGTVAGSTYGVAKKATVHAVRVLACDGSGSNSGVIQGVDWVAQNAQKPAIANMSLGGGNSKALDDAVKNAIRKDIAFVVAAGNDNKDACQGSPNRVPDAITVGSTTKSDQRSDFSNWGSCVDVFAPGSDITSAWFQGDSETKTISGTSMASPHVAGVVALYLAANTGARPKDVAKALTAASSEGKLGGLGKGSPNRLAYVSEKGSDSPGEKPPKPSDPSVFSVKCEGLSCDFNADSGNSHRWEFGDGDSAEGARATHAYDKAGLYEVTLAYTADKARKETRIISVEKPKSEPEPEPIPCEGCDKHAGSLSGPGQTAYHPSAEGASSAGGSYQAFLRGPTGTDYDFYLERRKADGGGGDGGSSPLPGIPGLPGLGGGSKKKKDAPDGNWEIVASGETPEHNERISQDVGEGVYRWRVVSKKGSGNYQLYVRNP